MDYGKLDNFNRLKVLVLGVFYVGQVHYGKRKAYFARGTGSGYQR